MIVNIQDCFIHLPSRYGPVIRSLGLIETQGLVESVSEFSGLVYTNGMIRDVLRLASLCTDIVESYIHML